MNAPRTTTQLIRYQIERRPAREVTQAGLINALLPTHEVELTDLRITRAWCRGKNTDRIVDEIANGRIESAEQLAVAICGVRRAKIPKLYEYHYDDDD